MTNQPDPYYRRDPGSPGAAPEPGSDLDGAALPTGEAPEDQAEPDYQELWQAARSENLKLQNDLKAVTNGRMKQDQRDQLLQRIASKLETQEQYIEALHRGVIQGDIDEAANQFSQIRESSARNQQAEDWQRFYLDKTQQLVDLVDGVTDQLGSPALDLNTAPELAPVRAAWLAARDRQDALGIQSLLNEAQRIAYDKRLALMQQWHAELPEAAEPSTEDALFSMNAAPVSGGSGRYRSLDQARNAFLGGRIDRTQYEEEERRFRR